MPRVKPRPPLEDGVSCVKQQPVVEIDGCVEPHGVVEGRDLQVVVGNFLPVGIERGVEQGHVAGIGQQGRLHGLRGALPVGTGPVARSHACWIGGSFLSVMKWS